jgi:hypothetical protein
VDPERVDDRQCVVLERSFTGTESIFPQMNVTQRADNVTQRNTTC